MQGLSLAKPIAVMIGQLAPGGSERQLFMFLAHCDRKRWTPVVYVSGELGFWEGPIRELGIPVVLLHGTRLAKMWRFRTATLSQKAKCFFSWSSYTNGFGLALAGCNVRRIGSFRNALFADLPQRFRWFWCRMSVAGVCTAVCNSRETMKQLSDRHPAKAVIYVPNAVDIPTREQVREWRPQWRARLGLRDDALLVVGVGRLAPQKQFARFIDVIAQVSQQLTVQAVIAGEDHGCLTGLKAQTDLLGLQQVVRFVGAVPDARKLMCAGDIFLLCSDYEGMPNVILEAMAAGVPCVTTGVNSIGDLIQHGVTGFVAEHNVNDLAQHVVLLAADAGVRNLLGARARAAIESGFQPAQVMRQLWAICE